MHRRDDEFSPPSLSSVRVGLFPPGPSGETPRSPPWRHVFGHFSGGGVVLVVPVPRIHADPRYSRPRGTNAILVVDTGCSTCVLYVVEAVCSQSSHIAYRQKYFSGKSEYLNVVFIQQ